MKPSVLAASSFLILSASAIVQAQEPALTPKSLAAAVAAKPAGADAERLAARVREYFGAEPLKRGAPPKIDETTVAWALEWAVPVTGSPPPRVSADIGNGFNVPLAQIGTTGVYVGVTTLSHGAALTWHYEIGPARVGGGQLEVYETHPD